jgi:hypothetical protein
MPIQISFSPLALEQKRSLLKEYPGLEKHFSRLEAEILNDPLSGAVEIMASKKR